VPKQGEEKVVGHRGRHGRRTRPRDDLKVGVQVFRQCGIADPPDLGVGLTAKGGHDAAVSGRGKPRMSPEKGTDQARTAALGHWACVTVK